LRGKHQIYDNLGRSNDNIPPVNFNDKSGKERYKYNRTTAPLCNYE